MCEAIQVNSGKQCTRCPAMGSKIFGFRATDAEMIYCFECLQILSRHLGFVSLTVRINILYDVIIELPHLL